MLVKIQHRLGHWGTCDQPATLSYIVQHWLAEGSKKEWDVEDADEYVNRHLRKARNKKQGERYMQDVPSYFKARRLLEELAFKA
jgi:hypothetical protein